jgi:hypothetical protein
MDAKLVHRVDTLLGDRAEVQPAVAEVELVNELLTGVQPT